MKIQRQIIVFSILCAMLSCTKENQAPQALFTIDPVAGNNETIFYFDASGCSDPDDPVEELMVSWDWEGDGYYDTQYASKKKADHVFTEPGEYQVTMVVKDTRGLTDTLAQYLNVVSSNLPPEVPTNPTPNDTQENLGINMYLSWVCIDPDEDHVLYTIYFGVNPDPPLFLNNHSYPTINPGRLEYGTTYYWKVKARDVKGNTTEGPVWSFTTIDLKFDSFTDDRDGKNYTTIQVGKQWWMAENLNYDLGEGSYCYENNLENCTKYGRLYTWEKALIACPTGWHLPSRVEFEELLANQGDVEMAGGNLKDYESSLWREPNAGANNISGFGALPGGRRYAMGEFAGKGYYAQFYSSSSFNNDEAYNLMLGYDYSRAFIYNYKKIYAISVRCVKD